MGDVADGVGGGGDGLPDLGDVGLEGLVGFQLELVSMPVQVAHRSHERKAGRPRVKQSKAKNIYQRDPIYRERSRIYKERLYQTRIPWLADLKVAAGCALCGYKSCSASLDFHHLDPGMKRFTVGQQNILRNRIKFYAEMRKCILVCRNCHSEIHHGGRTVDGIAPFEPSDYPPMPS